LLIAQYPFVEHGFTGTMGPVFEKP
jgi:hypothetical protein